MRKIYNLICLCFSLVLLNSCETDVDVSAPYKEIAIVYGLLDQQDSIQLIKINKAFTGKGNAFEMAKNPDSSFYNAEDVEVTLEKLKGTESHGFITLHDTIISGKPDGVFSQDKNQFFYTREQLLPEFIYKLHLYNKKTGYEADAKTGLINNLAFKQGSTNISFVGTDNKFANTTLEWLSQPNGKIYQVTLRFHYAEFITGPDTTFKYIDWIFSPQNSVTSFGGQQMEQTIKGEEFYIYLSNKSDQFQGNFRRKALKVELILTCAGEEFQIYNDLNSSYSSTYQEKPVYTNVNNGVGILNCRTTSPSQLRNLSTKSLDMLINGTYTQGLGFE